MEVGAGLPGVAGRRWRARATAAPKPPGRPRPTAQHGVEHLGQGCRHRRGGRAGRWPRRPPPWPSPGGDQRRPAGQRLERRQAESLVERGVHGGRPRSAAAPGRPRRPRTRSARSSLPESRGEPRPPRPASAPQPRPPASTSSASGWRSATAENARTRVGTSLRGSSVPTKTTSGRPGVSRDVEGRQAVGVGSRRGLLGTEPAGVDPMGGDHHLGVDPAPAAAGLRP